MNIKNPKNLQKPKIFGWFSQHIVQAAPSLQAGKACCSKFTGIPNNRG